MFTFARTSEVCGIILLVVEGVCVRVKMRQSTVRERERGVRGVYVCVCNLRAILFVKYQNPLFFVWMCVLVCLCLCMFWVDVHSSGYLEIVCRFVFHTIVILVSFISSPSFRSPFVFLLLLSPFALISHNFLPNDVPDWFAAPGFEIRIPKSRAFTFVCYGCCCCRRLRYTQTIPGRLACLDGFLFLCQYEHNL